MSVNTIDIICVRRRFAVVAFALAAIVFAGSLAMGADQPATSAAATGAAAANSASPAASMLEARQVEIVRRDIAGSWTATVGRTAVRLQLSEAGKYTIDDQSGTYSVVSSSQLALVGSDGEKIVYDYDLSGDKLTLKGHDLKKPLEFARTVSTGGYASRLLNISNRHFRRKLGRICVVILVVILIRLFISLAKVVSRVVIFSTWGLFKFLYRSRKNRAMTLHLLMLNVFKYITYLLAAGFVLTEMGVNYAAYLASVSVIGLAIAFGAQGLVQDMVTGLLIILEGQFDVGDMVDIPPHTGVVEELGLRMTRLRNYLGQQVVIPNRAISSVANYRKGAQKAYVDMCFSDADSAEKAVKLAHIEALDVYGQFGGIVLSRPEVPQNITLSSGEYLVRLSIAIWPSQQWVIDAQLVPMLRESLKQAELTIKADRIAVFYHLAPDERIADLKDLLSKFNPVRS